MGKRVTYQGLTLVFIIAALLIILPPAHPADPLAQQQEAIARIDAFIDHFRKTGDYKSRVGDLQRADRELAASVEAFTARKDLASAALSLVRLGQIQRMQGKWEAAIAFYQWHSLRQWKTPRWPTQQVLMASSLEGYLKKRVEQLVGKKKQTPVRYSPGVPDFSIATTK